MQPRGSDAMTLNECRKLAATHRGVTYYPFPGARPEHGEIVRCSTSYAFVLYDGDRTPKATRPEDLCLTIEPTP